MYTCVYVSYIYIYMYIYILICMDIYVYMKMYVYHLWRILYICIITALKMTHFSKVIAIHIAYRQFGITQTFENFRPVLTNVGYVYAHGSEDDTFLKCRLNRRFI